VARPGGTASEPRRPRARHARESPSDPRAGEGDARTRGAHGAAEPDDRAVAAGVALEVGRPQSGRRKMTADSDGVEERASALTHAVESLLRELLRDSTRTPNKDELVRQYARAIVLRCLDRIG
jgi:hypothetical protein